MLSPRAYDPARQPQVFGPVNCTRHEFHLVEQVSNQIRKEMTTLTKFIFIPVGSSSQSVLLWLAGFTAG